MNPVSPEIPAAPKRAPTLYIIVGFKVFKSFVGFLIALGLWRLVNENLPDQFQRLLQFFRLDSERKFFVDLAARIGEITPSGLAWVAWGSFAYGIFMGVQAAGLALRVRWAVWLVIAESAFFVPIEVFELVHHSSWLIFGLLALNMLIVWYLYANRARLIRPHHA